MTLDDRLPSGGLTFPVVHLNGTGRGTLQAEYHYARNAAWEARQRLALVTCHGRDYYPLPGDAYFEARKVREAHLRSLDLLIEYLDAHLEHLLPPPGAVR